MANRLSFAGERPKCGLRRVVGLRARTQDSPTDTGHQRPVPLDQEGKCLAVPISAELAQGLGVGDGWGEAVQDGADGCSPERHGGPFLIGVVYRPLSAPAAPARFTFFPSPVARRECPASAGLPQASPGRPSTGRTWRSPYHL